MMIVITLGDLEPQGVLDGLTARRPHEGLGRLGGIEFGFLCANVYCGILYAAFYMRMSFAAFYCECLYRLSGWNFYIECSLCLVWEMRAPGFEPGFLGLKRVRNRFVKVESTGEGHARMSFAISNLF